MQQLSSIQIYFSDSIHTLSGSLHSLMNRLKGDVYANYGVFSRLEGKRLSKIKGKRGKWVLALSLQTQYSLKTQSFYPGAAV